MQTIRLLAAVLFAALLSAKADTQPRGPDRLRELVVFPSMSLEFNWGISCQDCEWVINQNEDVSDAIADKRAELKRRPDDIKLLMQLAWLLNSGVGTNESRSCYQKAEQLCRNKIGINSHDGLSLMTLGQILYALKRQEEAESSFRKAVLVSSNEWRCWIGLGNFLEDDSFYSMFSGNLRNMAAFGQMPPPALLNYRPEPGVLEKSEARCKESARCFDRAMAIAPKEPEVFFQRAGYMSWSSLQNCYIRYYRNNEKPSTYEWVSASVSKETIADLKHAAELEPKDYQYISLAAYFEYLVPMMLSASEGKTLDNVPDDIRKPVHEVITRLENLSQDPDKKIAAGALENAGILNMMLGNKPEAAASFRRAVALDPTREQSWDLWLGMLLGSTSPNELLPIAEARLIAKNSARNHIILSKILAQKLGKWKRACEQAEIAQSLETNNIVPPLLLGAIALKQSADTNQMAIAIDHFSKAKDLLDKMTINNDSRTRWHELTLDLAIVNGLENTPNDRKIARLCLAAILENNPDDEMAKEIQKALN